MPRNNVNQISSTVGAINRASQPKLLIENCLEVMKMLKILYESSNQSKNTNFDSLSDHWSDLDHCWRGKDQRPFDAVDLIIKFEISSFWVVLYYVLDDCSPEQWMFVESLGLVSSSNIRVIVFLSSTFIVAGMCFQPILFRRHKLSTSAFSRTDSSATYSCAATATLPKVSPNASVNLSDQWTLCRRERYM